MTEYASIALEFEMRDWNAEKIWIQTNPTILPNFMIKFLSYSVTVWECVVLALSMLIENAAFDWKDRISCSIVTDSDEKYISDGNEISCYLIEFALKSLEIVNCFYGLKLICLRLKTKNIILIITSLNRIKTLLTKICSLSTISVVDKRFSVFSVLYPYQHYWLNNHECQKQVQLALYLSREEKRNTKRFHKCPRISK